MSHTKFLSKFIKSSSLKYWVFKGNEALFFNEFHPISSLLSYLKIDYHIVSSMILTKIIKLYHLLILKIPLPGTSATLKSMKISWEKLSSGFVEFSSFSLELLVLLATYLASLFCFKGITLYNYLVYQRLLQVSLHRLQPSP